MARLHARRVALSFAVLLCASGCQQEPPMPEIATVPSFELTDQRGQKVRAESLRGQVWAANFIFTSCPDVCPVLTQKMSLVRKKIISNGHTARYVSFSVDPDTDTPQVLAAYAKEQGAEYDDWQFLTGPIDDVKSVVVTGLKQVMTREDKPTAKAKYNVLHGSHFLLIDQRGKVRGYYPSDEPGLVKLSHDAGRLIDGEGT